MDRDLTSTAILFRLYVRHQPGGPGEKAILLGQLTSLQKASSMQELASSLRTWRRHFARAREVEASLPDGVLLIKALETAVVQIAKEDAQAAFRLSTSRQQLALDQQLAKKCPQDSRKSLGMVLTAAHCLGTAGPLTLSLS